jgi:splicing factor 4
VAKLAGDQSSSQQSSSSAAVPRKRKSRWGDEARDEDRSINSAIASFSGSSSLTPEQQRQLIEQQEMAKLVASIQSATQRKGKGGKSDQYEYDSDEDTDGGTWEHKKRMQEMRKTLDKAKQLTAEGKGKHFIGDFLPPDELEKFLEKVQALKEGRDPDFSDYAKYKLGEDNIGYQLLQKAGWSDGLGLGAKEDGRTVPVNKGKQSLDNSGVGTEGVGEIKKEDDEFDVYRKRMMLAYRFRPNPLNNPRRPYY